MFAVSLPGMARERWTVTSNGPPGSVDERMWQGFAERVNARPEADIELKALIHGEAGAEGVYLSHLRRGRVQISTASFAISGAIVPEVALLSLPYLFESEAEIDFVIDGYLDEEFRRLFADQGLVLLRWMDVGWVNLYSVEPLLAPAGALNKRLRSPASLASRAFLQRVGADVVVLPFDEVVMGLDTGLIDGGITSGLMYAAALKDTAPHYTLTRHSYEVGFLLANGRWFDRLSADHQALVREGFPTTATLRRETRAYMADVMADLARGGHSRELRCEQRQAWVSAARQAQDGLVAELGDDAARLYQRILTAKAEFARQPGFTPVCPG
jgi:TRAP-type C4-dicarboxylate transport system substrate-binding protein